MYFVDIDPGWFSDKKRDHLCSMCHVRMATDEHHIEHKQMGGRHGAAKVAIERAENKTYVCRVCHAASHFIFLTESDGFCCRVCPRLQTCEYGKRTLELR